MNSLVARLSLYFILMMSGATVGAAALVFVMALAFQALQSALPGWVAGILVCAGAFIVAGALFAGALHVLKSPAVRRQAGKVDEPRLAAALGETFGAEIVALLQAHPRMGATIALLAGLATGISPELRKILRAAL